MEIQWSLVLFAALSAWGAGTFMIYVIASEWLGIARYIRRPALGISMGALIVGALASMTHLGHLDRIFGVLSNPASGIFVEGLSAGLLVVLIAVLLVALARNAKESLVRALGTIGLIPALVLVIAVGTSYLMASKPAWDVATLPLLSVTTALVLGSLTVFALALMMKHADAALSADGLKKLKVIALVAIALQVIMVAVYLASVAGAPFQEYSRSAARVLSGDLAPLFWAGVVLLGLAMPLVAVLLPKAGKSTAAADGTAVAAGASTGYVLAFAVLCAIFAAVAFRMVMFSIGSSIIVFGF